MKRFFAITVVLMILLMSLGCATVPETSAPNPGNMSLVSTVGTKQFVGESSRGTLDLNGWNPAGGR
jgi:uncharacterized protein YceK